jgi:class 3 adenylate cyclase/ketosteroid isomerase-like protein/tetratricopeptide (TPR) repeat protein
MSSDICAGCGYANVVGALFCAQCGRSLAARCGSCGAELQLSANFCSKCGAAVARDPAAGAEGALKVVSVVFSDLVGSTALQETLEPESVGRVMARFYEAMRVVVERHGGAIQKFIGDALVAVFGVPVGREDDALRAVRCAAAMIDALVALNDELGRTWGVRLEMRTGVNTGELAVSGEGIFVGDTMNSAARLEQAAAAGQVLIGEATWRLVRHHVTGEQVEPLELKGKSAPVRAWRLVSPVREPRDDPASEPVEAPLIGRAAELDRLRSALDSATSARACRLVTVIGSPGLGKSRLASEFAAQAREVARIVQGHCEPSGEGNTFLPVAEVVREAVSIGEADPPEVVREKLRALNPDDPDRERVVEAVAGVLGVGEQASAQETFWALRRGLEVLAREHPLVVVLDDVHWAQPMLLDLIEHLVEWIADAQVLLIVLARPELREARETLTAAGRRVADVIELEPLEPDQSRALVDGLLGSADLPGELLARVLETTEGNPLFLGELVRMLIDEGTLVRTGDGWAVAGGAEAVDVPPTIQALLAARIERLRADERAVVERAAVIGNQFYRGAVAELLAPPIRIGIDAHLEALRRKEMVEPEGIYWIDEPVYRFHHILIRDAAYRLLLKEARSVLHERFADWLEEKAGELVGEYEEVIGFHLEQAAAYRRDLGPLDDAGRALGVRAATRLLSAGRRALAREDLAAASNLLSRALACDSGNDVEILWDFAETVLSAGDVASAADVIDRYSMAASDEERGRARAAVLHAQLANLTGADDPTATAESIVDAAAELRALGDVAGEAKAWAVTAQTNARLGRVGEVESALDRALTAAREADDRRRTTAVLAAAPRAALWGPSSVVRASGRCLDVVRILRMTPGNRHVEALALRCQAVLEAMRGRTAAAREILAGARATLEELGLSLELHETRTHAGMVELLGDDPAAAVEHLEAALAGFTALGAETAAAHAAAQLGRALVARGGSGDAEAAVAQVTFAQEHGGEDLRTAIIGWSARGEALAQIGDPEDAIGSARRAVELAEPTDALADKADASMALARVLLAAGLQAEASDAARAAGAAYEAKGHSVGAQAAAKLSSAAAESGPVHRQPPAAGTGAGVLGDRPSERLLAEIHRLQREREYERLGALVSDDWYRVDRRAMGWDDLHGRDAFVAEMRSVFDASPDVREEVDEILACCDDVIAGVMAWRSRGRKAGESEVKAGGLYVFKDGRWAGAEYFEPDDRAAMLARYAELGCGQSALGDRMPERWEAELIRRVALHDADAVAQLYSEDYVLRDHRRVGGNDLDGRDGIRAAWESVFAIAPDVLFEVDEVLACDERVIALRTAFRGHGADGGGFAESAVGAVTVVEDGLVISDDQFDYDDTKGMLAHFAELEGRSAATLGDLPPELFYAEFSRRFKPNELDALRGMVTADFTMCDCRTGVSQELVSGPDAGRAFVNSIFADMGRDTRFIVDEVLACDQRVIALRAVTRGHAEESGGMFEVPTGIVSVVEDGLVRLSELHDYDDEARMLARFRELGGGLLGGRPPERLEAELARRVGLRDADAVAELFSPEYTLTDHRPVAHDNVLGPDDVRRQMQSIFELAPDVRFGVDEVLACDDRVIAMRVAFRGHAADGGGFGEVAIGVVSVVEDGRFVSDEQFEYDDTAAMLQRYAQLGGRPAALGDRPPERVWADYVRRIASHDVDAILAIGAKGFAQRDHRLVATGDVAGVKGMRALFESMFTMTRNLRVDIDEVLACDARVIALRIAYRGTAADTGGPLEVPLGVVSVVKDGRMLGADNYPYDDDGAILARYAELGGQASAPDDRPPARAWAEAARLLCAHDVDAFTALLRAEFELRDHRPMVGMVTGRDATRETLVAVIAVTPDLRFEIDEVLACDDRVIAIRAAYRGHAAAGGGEAELLVGYVSVVRDGVFVATDVYEYEDDAAMLTQYAARGGGLSALGDSPPEQWFAEFARRFAGQDVEPLIEMISEEYELIDHRQLAWEPVRGRAGFASLAQAAYDAGTIWMEIDEVLASGDRVIALTMTYRGKSIDGGGVWELPVGVVIVVEAGLHVNGEHFDPGDRHAMLARYKALGGRLTATLGGRLPERMTAEHIRHLAAGEIDAVVAQYDEDFVLCDHRPGVSQDIHGHAELRSTFEAMLSVTREFRVDIDEVLACDDRVCAMRVAYRGRAADGGGEMEILVGSVSVVRDRLYISTDLYDYSDDAGMIARYAELGGRRTARLGDRPIELITKDYMRLLAARDVDALMERFDNDYVMRDHRAIVSQDIPGRAGLRATFEAMLSATRELRLDVDEVLACDDHVSALRTAYRGLLADGGGEMEALMGYVSVVREGRYVSTDAYDYDDIESMLARFAELAGRVAVAGQRTPDLFSEEEVRRYNAHDLGAVVELFSQDYVVVDHRLNGWAGIEGRDALRGQLQAGLAMSADVRFDVDEVIARDDRVMVRIVAYRGHADEGGGEFDLGYGEVSLHENGVVVSSHVYEAEDRQAMIARYAELGGGLSALGDAPLERFYAEFARRFAQRDLQLLLELVSEDYVLIDHRVLGWEPVRGHDGFGQLQATTWEASDVRIEVDEVLAVGDGVIALIARWTGHTNAETGGGEFDVPIGRVTTIVAGRVARVEQFEPDDRRGMLARFAELGRQDEPVPGSGSLEGLWAEYGRRWAAADATGVTELYAEDSVLRDHRSVALWGEARGRDALAKLVESGLAGVRDPRFTVHEVLARDDHVIALRVAWTGTAGANHDVSFSYEIGTVAVARDGRVVSNDVYDTDDRQAMIARYVELGGGLSAFGETPAEQVSAEFARCYARQDSEGLLRCTSEEIVFTDHRPMGWEPVRSNDGYVELMRTGWNAIDIRMEPDDVLVASDHVLAHRLRWVGTGDADWGGGPFALAVGHVTVVGGGRIVSVDQYEYDDTEAMLTRFNELSTASSVRGDRPPERFYAEYARRWAAGDRDGLIELAAEEWVQRDHRPVPLWGTVRRDQLVEWLKAALGGVRDPRHQILEVLACDDEVIAFRACYSGIAPGGVEFEIEAGVVAVVRDGLGVSEDDFDPDDRQAMIAQYVELGGGLSRIGDGPAERVFADYARRYVRRELEPLIELIAEDYVGVDHRRLGWEPVHGRDAFAALMRSTWDGNDDLRIEVDEVLAADPRVLATRQRWVGRGSAAGAFEIAVGQVIAIEDGRIVSADQYEPDDCEAMLARFAELSRRDESVLGDRPSERLLAEVRRRLNARDYEAFLAMVAHDWHLLDHRPLGWGEMHGREACGRLQRSIFDSSPNVSFDFDEVLACDDHMVVTRVAVRGEGVKAGPLEVPVGAIYLFEAGQWASVEFFEPDELQAMITRYVELGGGLSALGDSPLELVFAELARAAGRRDMEAMLECIADDYTLVDHRGLAWEPQDGPDGFRGVWESAFRVSTDIRMEVDEVLAVGEFTIALLVSWTGRMSDDTGGGEFSLEAGQVLTLGDGAITSIEQYDPADREAILARFRELCAASPSPPHCPPELFSKQEVCRYNAHDLHAFLELFSQDYVVVDHRANGWGTIENRDAYRAHMMAGLEMSADVRFDVDEVIACDDRVLVRRVAYRGHADEGGSEFELPLGVVTVHQNGWVVSSDVYEPDARQAMIARYTELGGGLSALGDSPPEQLWAEFARRFARQQLEPLLALFADDYVQLDHRILKWEPIRGHAGVTEQITSAWGMSSDIRAEVDEVLAVNESVIAFRLRWAGHTEQASGAGEFIVEAGEVAVIEDGRIVKSEYFAPDARHAMLVRFAELAGEEASSTA